MPAVTRRSFVGVLATAPVGRPVVGPWERGADVTADAAQLGLFERECMGLPGRGSRVPSRRRAALTLPTAAVPTRRRAARPRKASTSATATERARGAGGGLSNERAHRLVHDVQPLAVSRGGAGRTPIRTPADFAGRHFRGHATDVALQTFPALAARARSRREGGAHQLERGRHGRRGGQHAARRDRRHLRLRVHDCTPRRSSPTRFPPACGGSSSIATSGPNCTAARSWCQGGSSGSSPHRCRARAGG